MLKSIKSLNSSFLLSFVFVLLVTSGFTCQKKYPEPPPEKETTEAAEPSSEDSNPLSEVTPKSESDSKKTDEKSNQ